jgi:hypothetical protein
LFARKDERTHGWSGFAAIFHGALTGTHRRRLRIESKADGRLKSLDKHPHDTAPICD